MGDALLASCRPTTRAGELLRDHLQRVLPPSHQSALLAELASAGLTIDALARVLCERGAPVLRCAEMLAMNATPSPQ